MKSNTKSSITLPVDQLELVDQLRDRLKFKTKVEVVRRGLMLLKEATDRESLRQAYRRASSAVRNNTRLELEELDHLAAENLE
jgi:Arc/MetJ-type ribon-helix-helix transcriptional regulator